MNNVRSILDDLDAAMDAFGTTEGEAAAREQDRNSRSHQEPQESPVAPDVAPLKPAENCQSSTGATEKGCIWNSGTHDGEKNRI
jgi:hypothetical protein